MMNKAQREKLEKEYYKKKTKYDDLIKYTIKKISNANHSLSGVRSLLNLIEIDLRDEKAPTYKRVGIESKEFLESLEKRLEKRLISLMSKLDKLKQKAHEAKVNGKRD